MTRMNSKIMIRFYPLSIITALFLMTSCRAPKDLVYRDFKNLSIEKLGFAASLIKLDLVCYNPNNFSLLLKNTDLDISIDNNFLGHTAQDYQVTIPKRNEFTLPVQIELDMKNMLKNALIAFSGKEVLLKVTGKVKVGKANVFKSFPVNYEGKQRFVVF